MFHSTACEPGLRGPGPIVDPQGRTLDYLRLAVTDRCNLRCRYCMPAEGIDLADRQDVLTLEEMARLGGIFAGLGVRKIRITGGEPLVRKGVVGLIADLAKLPSRPEILLTTNGLLLGDALDELHAAGLRRINLSLDTLDAQNFRRITRRDGFAKVRGVVDRILDLGMGLKINVVLLPGWNDHEIPDFVDLTRNLPVVVRFIEPMPFDGSGRPLTEVIDGPRILERCKTRARLEPEPREKTAVDQLYAVTAADGTAHRGRVGIIEGHSRTFCSTCSRLRIDARGCLRTCLYGKPQVNFLEMVRSGATDAAIVAAIDQAVGRRLIDGLAAEADTRKSGAESMASIGG